MKKTTRALTLLTATALTFGSTAVIAPLATAVEAQEPTMADQYEPYFEDLTFSAAFKDSARTSMITAEPLPVGTTFHLLDANISENLRRENGVLFSLDSMGNPYLHIQQSGVNPVYNDSGNTAISRVLVQYPDGSQDFIETHLTIIPSLAQVKAVTYRATELEFGETKDASPTINSTRATGTKYTLIQSADLDTARQQGWEFAIDNSTGQITATAPEEWSTVDLEVLALYPDGTSQAVTAKFNAAPYEEPYTPEPEPEPTPSDRSFGSSSS